MVRRLLQLRRGEARRALLLFAYLFLVMASYIVAKNTRDALFLERFSADRDLPLTNVASVLSIAAVMSGYVRLSRRVSLQSLLTATLLVSSVVTVAFWEIARGREPEWMIPVLYVWFSVMGVLLPAQVWTLANHVVTAREAKRLFRIVGSGAISGAIVGGLVTQIARRIGAANLLLMTATIFAACPLLVLAIWRERHAGTSLGALQAEAGERGTLGFGAIWRSPHLRTMAGMVGCCGVVTTIIAWQFVTTAKVTIHDTDQLTVFLGRFTVYAGILSLATQLVAAPYLLGRLGLGGALVTTPIALTFGSAGLLTFGNLPAAAAVRGADQVLRYSVDKSSLELLYLPVPARVLARAKALIDTVVWRIGDTTGWFLVLVGARTLRLSVAEMSAVALVFLAGWIGAALAARRSYVVSLRQGLYAHRLDAERLADQTAEPSTVSVLVAALDSEDAAVRRDAIAALSAAGDSSALARIEPFAHDVDAAVRAEALVYLARCGQVDPLLRIDELDQVSGDALVVSIAQFLAQPGFSERVDTVRLLLDNAADHVRQRIPHLLERIGTPDAERVLLEYLVDRDPVLRLDSVTALNRLMNARREHGDPIERPMVEAVLEAEILGHYRSYQLLGGSGGNGGGAEDPAMRRAMAQEVERIFRLLKLLLPEQDLHSAYFGVQSANPVIHANALEFLDHALPTRLRMLLLPLIDSEVSVRDRIALADRMLGKL